MPRIIPFGFGEEPLNFGDTAQLQCLVSANADLPVQFTWSFHGTEVVKNKKQDEGTMQIMKLSPKSSLLIIESLKANDSGNYTCRATNAIGSHEYTTTLVVNGTHTNTLLIDSPELFVCF